MYVVQTILAFITYTLAFPLSSKSSDTRVAVSQIYQFPEKNHWFENLVVRPNGMILATELTTPKLWLLDPSLEATAGNIQLIHEFPQYLGLLGIVECLPDIFAFIAGNFSTAQGFKSYPGTYAIWSVDFNQGNESAVEKIADIPGADFLNGMAYLESANAILLGDAGLGVVWKLDLETKASMIAINDTLMSKISPDAPDGINGLKVYGDELWFTRGFDSIVAKMQISKQGTAVGSTEIVGVGLNSTWTMDDLVVNPQGQAFVAIPFQNLIARFDGGKSQPVVVAGSLNSTEIAEPTSLAFARTGSGHVDEAVIYVATGGAIADPIDGVITVGGQIVRLQLCGERVH